MLDVNIYGWAVRAVDMHCIHKYYIIAAIIMVRRHILQMVFVLYICRRRTTFDLDIFSSIFCVASL